MRAFVLAVLIVATFSRASYSQLDEWRSSFFTQRIDSIKIHYANHATLKISPTRLKWDTTDYVFTRFFTKFDTTDTSDLSIKSKPTKRKIVTLMNELSETDYALIRQQIRNQSLQPSAKEIVLHRGRRIKSKSMTTFYFSMPLLVKNGSTLFVKEKMVRSDGYEWYLCLVYRNVGNKWVKDMTLEQISSAIP